MKNSRRAALCTILPSCFVLKHHYCTGGEWSLSNKPVQHLLVRLDNVLNPFINRVKVTVGDDNCDFDNDIRLVVQTYVFLQSSSILAGTFDFTCHLDLQSS